MKVWAAAWDRVVKAARSKVGPAVSLKAAKAGALLMAAVGGVTLKVIARMIRVMARVAAMAMVEAARNMAVVAVMVMTRMGEAMVAVTRVMVEVTAEVRVMAEERGRVTAVVDEARVRVTDRVAVMVMAKADRVMVAVDRTMVRAARVMAVDEAGVKATARGIPVSTVTVTAVVTI
jgi:hypothetical protein